MVEMVVMLEVVGEAAAWCGVGLAVSEGHCYRDRLNIRQPPHLYGCSRPRITPPGFKAGKNNGGRHFNVSRRLLSFVFLLGFPGAPGSRDHWAAPSPTRPHQPPLSSHRLWSVGVAGFGREGKQYLGRGKCCPFATMTGAGQPDRFPC